MLRALGAKAGKKDVLIIVLLFVFIHGILLNVSVAICWN